MDVPGRPAPRAISHTRRSWVSLTEGVLAVNSQLPTPNFQRKELKSAMHSGNWELGKLNW